MSPFTPTGYLTVTAAIDRVVELRQGGDLSRLLTEDETATLRDYRAWRDRIKRPQPAPIGPRSPGEKYPHKPVEAEPPRPDMTREKYKDLLEKEAFFNEQRRVAEQVLRQILYAGQVPWVIIAEDGTRIAAPKHLAGGNQWYEALRSNGITWRPGILSVTGFPVISRDALEAVFNPEGTVKEEPEPVAPKPVIEGTDERPQHQKPTKQRNDRWVAMAKKLKEENPKIPVTQIAAKIKRADQRWNEQNLQSDKPSESRKVMGVDRIRRVLYDQQSEWCFGR